MPKGAKSNVSEDVAESELRNAIDTAPDLILFLNTKGIITYCNEATARMSGCPKSRIIGQHFSKLKTLKPGGIFEYLKIFVSLLKGDVPEPFEATGVRKDGKLYPMEIHMGLLKKAGKITGIQVIGRDISQRKKLLKDLEDSEEKYRSMIEESTDAMLLLDESGHLIFSNKAVDEITGRGHINDVGRNVLKLGIINPKDLPKVKKVLTRILEGEKVSPFKIMMVRSDNIDILVEVHGTGIDYLGEPCILVTLKDITEHEKMEEALKSSEEKLNAVFASIKDGIVITDLNGKITQVNPSILRMYGYKNSSDLIGRSILDFPKSDERVNVDQFFKSIIKTRVIPKLVCNSRRQDGSEFPVEVIASINKNKFGIPIGFVAVVRDITERKKTEKKA